jgi:hypothetical protein
LAFRVPAGADGRDFLHARHVLAAAVLKGLAQVLQADSGRACSKNLPLLLVLEKIVQTLKENSRWPPKSLNIYDLLELYNFYKNLHTSSKT